MRKTIQRSLQVLTAISLVAVLCLCGVCVYDCARAWRAERYAREAAAQAAARRAEVRRQRDAEALRRGRLKTFDEMTTEDWERLRSLTTRRSESIFSVTCTPVKYGPQPCRPLSYI